MENADMNRKDAKHELSHLRDSEYNLDTEQQDAVYYAQHFMSFKRGLADTLEQFKENNYQFTDDEDKKYIDFVFSIVIDYFKMIDNFEERGVDRKIKLLDELWKEIDEETQKGTDNH